MRLMTLAARTAALTLIAGAALPAQQDDARRAREEAARDARDARDARREAERGRVFRFGGDEPDRAALGVGTSSGGERDTLGLLVTAITPGGPAERAGLEEGNRIAAVNGVNLRLAPADAGEPDMQGMVTRRLTRELAKVRPGDAVELRVWQNGQYRTLRVRTVAADSLPGRRRAAVAVTREERSREREARARERDDRAVLGLELHPTGNRRDTLGVLVARVAEDGPAERAGLVEGDRVAAVNGVDLRVAREDAGDDWVANAKSSRFSREMQRVRPGQAVELRVYSGGRYRTVRVNAARRGDVYKEGTNVFFRSAFFDGELAPPAPLPPLPPERPLPPEPPLPPHAPHPPEPPEPFIHEFEFTPPGFNVRVDTEAIRRRVDEAMARVQLGRGTHWI